MHTFLKSLKINDYIDCVYYVNYKYSNVSSKMIASNGNKYVILKIKDASLENNEFATVFYYYKNEAEIIFLQEGYKNRTAYLKIYGRCFETYPFIKIVSNSIIRANRDSDIIFDTSNLFAYSDYYKNRLLSIDGLTGVALRNTSSAIFQENFFVIAIGDKLRYERIKDSPYDKYQINVFVEYIDEVFNIPAYLTPTMGKLIDEGYKFEITVTDIPPRDESLNFNAGIRVSIKGMK